MATVKQKKNLYYLLLICFLLTRLLGQTMQTISAPIWVYYEDFPISTHSQDDIDKKPCIEELENLGRFVLSGMIFGWEFSYTPADKTRNVREYFDIKPVNSISNTDKHFYITDLSSEYPRLYSWARYTVHDEYIRRLERLESVVFSTAIGRGTSNKIFDSEGIIEAYENALLNAVNNYARKEEKNKPKEIRGEIILRNNPRVYMKSGQYIADIKVLIRLTEIVPYVIF